MRQHRAHRPSAVVLLLAALALLAASCTSDDTATSEASDTDRIGGANSIAAAALPGSDTTLSWADCLDPDDEPEPGEVVCTTIEAPIDYDDPDGETLRLAVEVVPAGEPDPIGSLFVNFGGPGSETVPWASTLPEAITSRFNVVGMDPRGVGQSGRVVCGPVPDGVDLTPTADEFEAYVVQSTVFASACLRDTGALLGAVGTDNVARDIDHVRDALGEEQITYYGYSYGTLLGARYADLFPDRVRAMVLDGAADPTAPLVDRFVEMAIGREKAFDRFLAECAADSTCAFHSDGDPAAAFDALRAEFLSGTAEGEQFAEVLTAAPNAIFYRGQPAYDGLAHCLAALAEPGFVDKPETEVLEVVAGACALPLAGDGPEDPEDPEDPEGDDADDPFELPVVNPLAAEGSFHAINCADYPTPTREQLEAAEARVAAEAPRFGAGAVEAAATCLTWPTPPTGTNTAVTAEGLPLIVVINTTHDGATPLVTAERMVAALPEARLIVVDGAVHGSFPLEMPDNGPPEACLDVAVIDYLVDLEAPPEGLQCSVIARAPGDPRELPGRPNPLFTTDG